MVMKRYILTCICCGIFAGGVLAQQQDSIAKMRDAAAAQDSAMQRRSQADTAYRVKFNAMKYSMQKRYQPKSFLITSSSVFGVVTTVLFHKGI